MGHHQKQVGLKMNDLAALQSHEHVSIGCRTTPACQGGCASHPPTSIFGLDPCLQNVKHPLYLQPYLKLHNTWFFKASLYRALLAVLISEADAIDFLDEQMQYLGCGPEPCQN